MESDNIKPDAHPERTEAARKWLERFDAAAGESLSQEEWQSWDMFAADDGNLAALNRLAELREQMRAAVPPSWPSRAELLADCSDEHEWGAATKKQGESARTPRRLGLATRFFSNWAASGAVAVMMALMVLFTLFRFHLFGLQFALSSDFPRALSTATGEQRRVPLPDGSVITLGARSTVSVNFTGSARNVELTSGEALFEVARASSRPFKVKAGGGTVTALGTSFNISRTLQRVVVTVAEGSVLVAPQPTSNNLVAWTPVRVALGEQMSYQVGGEFASPIAPADSQSETAWSHGTLVYRRRPLSEVIDDVKRYTDAEIEVDDGVGSLPPFSGTVAVGKVRGWIRALSQIYPVEIDERDDRHVSIRLRADHLPTPESR